MHIYWYSACIYFFLFTPCCLQASVAHCEIIHTYRKIADLHDRPSHGSRGATLAAQHRPTRIPHPQQNGAREGRYKRGTRHHGRQECNRREPHLSQKGFARTSQSCKDKLVYVNPVRAECDARH